MTTAVLPNGTSYSIPQADMPFFKELAARMKWKIVGVAQKATSAPSAATWVDEIAGKWEDKRSTTQILKDIHEARTDNSDIQL